MTNDVGYITDNGCLRVLGRKSDLIKKSSYVIFTYDIEKILNNQCCIDTCVIKKYLYK